MRSPAAASSSSVAKFARQEWWQLRALLLLLAGRRPALQAPPSIRCGYAKPILLVMIVACAADVALLLILHFVVAHPGWRLALDVAGVLGALWFCGFIASLVVYRHEIGPALVRLRFGAWYEVRATPAGHTTHTRIHTFSPHGAAAIVDDCLYFPVGGMVNIEMICDAGFSLESPTARLDDQRVQRLRFWVDNVDDVVAAI